MNVGGLRYRVVKFENDTSWANARRLVLRAHYGKWDAYVCDDPNSGHYGKLVLATGAAKNRRYYLLGPDQIQAYDQAEDAGELCEGLVGDIAVGELRTRIRVSV